MNRESWPDAQIWARLPRFPMIFFGGFYGFGSVALIISKLVRGRGAELLKSGDLFVLGWGLFAVLLCVYNIWIIGRAKRYMRSYMKEAL